MDDPHKRFADLYDRYYRSDDWSNVRATDYRPMSADVGWRSPMSVHVGSHLLAIEPGFYSSRSGSRKDQSAAQLPRAVPTADDGPGDDNLIQCSPG